MIRLEAIVRPEKFDDVKDALQRIGVIAMTVDEVLGCGHQGGACGALPRIGIPHYPAA